MKYCSHCAEPLKHIIPQGDNRPRYTCLACGAIHYQNPKMIAGSIPVRHIEGQPHVLLCKRGIEPRLGYWTIPAGFLELGETLAQGAARETLEEADIDVEITRLHGLYSIPHIGQVYAVYLASLTSLDFGPTPESTEVQLFSEQQVPWDEIAFDVVGTTLREFFDDQRTGYQGVHTV